MGTSRRTQIARAAAALAVVAAAVVIAVAVADRRSEDAIDVPAGGLPEPQPDPGPPPEIVLDEPEGEPEGLVWVLCCGAWRPPGTYGIDLSDRGDRTALGSVEWARRGYLAASFAARGEDSAVEEAVAAYDRLHSEHPDLEICAIGGSAAGHMALMVAARRPELRCVVAHSAPSALADLPDEPVPGVLDEAPIELALDVFGRDRLEELSPLTHASEIRASVRMAVCSADQIVPPEQSRRLARALREGPAADVELTVIPGASVRRGARPPRGFRHVIHECFALDERVVEDHADTVEFVEGALGGEG